MVDADWLEVWRNELTVYSDGKPVLELGCGIGNDARQITAYGLEVISLDIGFKFLTQCSDIDGCFPVNADVSAPLPFTDNAFGFVLASLSLHYFTWPATLLIADEISRVLHPGGMLLLRVNSTDDVNFGAGSGEVLERNYCLVNGQKKRFFERSDVESMLQGMNNVELWHDTIDRYGKEKQVWVAQAFA